MRTRLYILLIAVLAVSQVWAQPHSVSVGLRGGAGTYLAVGELKNCLVPNAMVDVGYSFMVPVKNVELGIMTGLSFGYTGGAYHKDDMIEKYSNTDYLGYTIDYTCTAAHVKERIHGFTLEIPAMFAFHMKGLVLNAGIKIQVPMWYRYHQDLVSPNVNAYYPDFGVNVLDELITGDIPTELNGTIGRRDIGDVSILLGFELGYEWQLTASDRIGLMAYFDGAPYSHPAGSRTQHIIDVAPITDPYYPVPEVKVNTLVGTYAERINYLDFGIKLYYRFAPVGHQNEAPSYE